MQKILHCTRYAYCLHCLYPNTIRVQLQSVPVELRPYTVKNLDINERGGCDQKSWYPWYHRYNKGYYSTLEQPISIPNVSTFKSNMHKCCSLFFRSLPVMLRLRSFKNKLVFLCLVSNEQQQNIWLISWQKSCMQATKTLLSITDQWGKIPTKLPTETLGVCASWIEHDMPHLFQNPTWTTQ